VCTAVGAWHWLTDPHTSAVSFTQSLWNHPFFAIASVCLGNPAFGMPVLHMNSQADIATDIIHIFGLSQWFNNIMAGRFGNKPPSMIRVKLLFVFICLLLLVYTYFQTHQTEHKLFCNVPL